MNKHTWKPLFAEETIRKFYCDYQMTYDEVAARLGVTRKVIWTLLRYYKIQTRKPAKRNQAGALNHSWKGAEAGYQACHLRVESRFGKPQHCSECGTVDQNRTYDWANVTGKCEDPADYIRLCRQCHRKFDGRFGSGLHSSKLKESEIPQIRERRKSGETLASIAKSFGVCPSTISRVCLGKHWTHA
jgi:hypothetical protein